MKVGRASWATGLVATLTLATATASYARNCENAVSGPFATGIPAGGQLVERATAPAVSNISLTDRSGAEIGAGTITGVQINRVNVAGGFVSNPVTIPNQVNTAGGKVDVCDIRQTIKILDPPLTVGGEIADLSIEAVVFNPVTGKFGTANIFDTLANQVGLNKIVPVPDLFADTNGDGVLGAGDVLYSVVDLNKYLLAVPNFSLGETFNIIGGVVAGLPGMEFSSTPFSLNPDTGEFGGTPITVLGFSNAAHDPEAIPEPDTVSLLAAAFLGLPLLRMTIRRTTAVRAV